jgi:hypothetical protein
MNSPVSSLAVRRARTFLKPVSRSGGLFDLSRVEGRVVEVSEAGFFGALSALCGLMAQVQTRSEPIAWVATGGSVFFPPDLAFRGLDLAGFSVVSVPDGRSGLLAADWLVRSGAFGLVVVDWSGGDVDEGVLGRLAKLAEEQGTAVVFLTRKKPEDASLGTQVSLRGVVSLSPAGETGWQVKRDKHSGPVSEQRVVYHGPFGLY